MLHKDFVLAPNSSPSKPSCQPGYWTDQHHPLTLTQPLTPSPSLSALPLPSPSPDVDELLFLVVSLMVDKMLWMSKLRLRVVRMASLSMGWSDVNCMLTTAPRWRRFRASWWIFSACRSRWVLLPSMPEYLVACAHPMQERPAPWQHVHLLFLPKMPWWYHSNMWLPFFRATGWIG